MTYTAQLLQSGQIPKQNDSKAVRAIATSGYSNILRLKVDTYESLIQTGNITRLSNENIRNALYELDSQLTYFNTQSQNLSSITIEHNMVINDIKGRRYDEAIDNYVPYIRFDLLEGNEEKLNSIMSLFRIIRLGQRLRINILAEIEKLNGQLE